MTKVCSTKSADAGGARPVDAPGHDPRLREDRCRPREGGDHRRPGFDQEQQKARDLEMHQTKKGNHWYFGMKAHIGVDVACGVVHTLIGTPANEADINQMAALWHGQETDVFVDAGYTGADKRAEFDDRDVSWNIAIKRSIIKALPESPAGLGGADGAGAGEGASLGRAPVPRGEEPPCV